MSDNPWTPAPWSTVDVDSDGTNGWWIRLKDFDRGIQQAVADARLIALAPEMAELLDEVVRHGDQRRSDPLVPMQTICDEAAALLARARGET